jgi:hypothetical protein
VEAGGQRRDVTDWTLLVSGLDVIGFRVGCCGRVLRRRTAFERWGVCRDNDFSRNCFLYFQSLQDMEFGQISPLGNKLTEKVVLNYESPKKMNQHIIIMANSPSDAKLYESRCSGALLAPQQAGGVTGGNACSRCFACRGLSINRQRIHPIKDKTSAFCCRAEFGARERHESSRRCLAFDDFFGS